MLEQTITHSFGAVLWCQLKTCSACGSARCSEDWECADCGNVPAKVGQFTAFAPAFASEAARFKEEYFAELAGLEAGNFWFRARYDLIIWAMTRYFPQCRKLLEIGCGTGFVLHAIESAFPSTELSGSEIFTGGLEFASKRVPSAQFYQMDARVIPFRDHFDLIGAFDVLEHIEDDEAVIAEVSRAVRQGGGFLISVPQHPLLWSAQDRHALHARRYRATELRRKVEASGFEVIRTTSFVSLLLPLMVAARLRKRGSKADANTDPFGELQLPRAIDSAMETVMRAERVLIRRGLSFPAGGSLLMIAQKPGRSEAAR